MDIRFSVYFRKKLKIGMSWMKIYTNNLYV